MNDNCLTNQSNKNLRIMLKKPRKTKPKSILPMTMRDVDEDHHFQPEINKSNLKNEDIVHGKPVLFISQND